MGWDLHSFASYWEVSILFLTLVHYGSWSHSWRLARGLGCARDDCCFLCLLQSCISASEKPLESLSNISSRHDSLKPSSQTCVQPAHVAPPIVTFCPSSSWPRLPLYWPMTRRTEVPTITCNLQKEICLAHFFFFFTVCRTDLLRLLLLLLLLVSHQEREWKKSKFLKFRELWFSGVSID